MWLSKHRDPGLIAHAFVSNIYLVVQVRTRKVDGHFSATSSLPFLTPLSFCQSRSHRFATGFALAMSSILPGFTKLSFSDALSVSFASASCNSDRTRRRSVLLRRRVHVAFCSRPLCRGVIWLTRAPRYYPSGMGMTPVGACVTYRPLYPDANFGLNLRSHSG